MPFQAKRKKKAQPHKTKNKNAVDLERIVKLKVTAKPQNIQIREKEHKKYVEKSLSQHRHLAFGEVFNYLFTP